MDKLFFDGFESIARIIVSVPFMYVAVVAFVRLSGKRTTSQMNGFDWVVTVAMGSLVASGIISRSVPLFDALAAIGSLLALQYAVTWYVQRNSPLEKLIKSEPRLLVSNGRFLPEALAKERVTESEILSTVRGTGVASIEEVAAVVLETDASLSVISRGTRPEGARLSVLDDVHGTDAVRA